MKRLTRGYTDEFRAEAIKYVLENNLKIKPTAEELGIPESTLRTWLKKYKEEGILKNQQRRKPLKAEEAELQALKKELATVKME